MRILNLKVALEFFRKYYASEFLCLSSSNALIAGMLRMRSSQVARPVRTLSGKQGLPGNRSRVKRLTLRSSLHTGRAGGK